jgi:hypothetical protein
VVLLESIAFLESFQAAFQQNNGFPMDSFDGLTFADKVHFNCPAIDGNHKQVQPSQHGVFSSSE